MGSTEARQPSRRRAEIRGLIRIANTVTGLAAMVTLIAWGARWNSLCELAINWPVQLAVVATLTCTILTVSRRWKMALLAGAVAGINVTYVAPVFLPREHVSLSGPSYRAVSANILTSNQETQRFQDFVRSTNPDLVVVLEINLRWAEALLTLDKLYPYSIIEPREDNFGIALLSRHPISSHRVEQLADSRVPTIIATIDLPGQSLNVIGTHPEPPIGPRRAAFRNAQLDAIADVVSQTTRPVIVLGDLNASPYSPQFQELLQRSGLRDSRQGFGVLASWPNRPWVLRIPIDHALLSPDLTVTDRYVGPNIGSDHRPIVVDFACVPN